MAAGLYIHVPFCASKCPYCDFYSLCGSAELYDAYTEAVVRELKRTPRMSVNTVYFGGGTPSVLGGDRLARMLGAARERFGISPEAEITAEINPGDASEKLLTAMRDAGFDRISMGVQSGVDLELRALGRRHDTAQAARAVALARDAGFDNISLDLMLAVPGQNGATLERSVDFLCSLGPEHISAYLLKLEEGTPFAAMKDALCLPDDDAQAELYLQAVGLLEKNGYRQYEISNFAKPDRESRHNLKYWRCEEYIGIGPAAHGFVGGRRYYYPRDIAGFIADPQPVDDGEGGSEEEYVMLALRLSEGLTAEGWSRRYGGELPRAMLERAKLYEKAGLLVCGEKGIRLLPQGFLVSNSIIAELIDSLES